MSKIIVVGANHAGTAAINTILDQYPGNEVVVYDRNDNISFLGCGMALWIGKQDDRSEERRVGKECRSRWSPYH